MDTGGHGSDLERILRSEKYRHVVFDPKPKFCDGCKHKHKLVTRSPCWGCKGDRYEVDEERD